MKLDSALRQLGISVRAICRPGKRSLGKWQLKSREVDNARPSVEQPCDAAHAG